MDFDAMFTAQLDALKKEGNYRIFAELERECRRRLRTVTGCANVASDAPLRLKAYVSHVPGGSSPLSMAFRITS